MANDPFAQFEELKPASPEAIAADPYAGLQQVDSKVLEMPDYANGLRPEAALNKSPLSATERLTIKGLGNRKEDIEKSLATRFGAVTKGQDGEYRVKDKDGLWYQVDPDTLDGRDAIDVTRGILRGTAALVGGGAASIANNVANPFIKLFGGKGLETNPLALSEMIAGDNGIAREMVGEAAENFDTGAMVAAGTVAAPLAAGATLATIGTAAAIGGGASALTKLGLTSLGRLEGTYDAPVEEQLKDSAYEFGLGMLGTFVPAGVRFGLDKFASKNVAANATAVLSKAPEEKLGMIKSFFEGVVDDVSIDRLATPGNKVQRYMNEQAAGGGNLLKFQDDMRIKMVSSIKGVAGEAIEGLSDVYKNQVDEFLQKVPHDFEVNTRDMVQPIIDDLVGSGLVGMKLIETAPGKFSEVHVLKSFAHIQRSEAARALTAEAREIAFDKPSYKALEELFYGMQRMARRKGVSGKEAVTEMMADQKILRNMTRTFQQKGKGARVGEIENNVLYRTASKYGEALKNALPDALGKDLGSELRNINASYRSLKETILPLEKALASDKDALMLASAMTGKTAAGTLNRASLPNVVKSFTTYGGKNGEKLAGKLVELTNDISDMKAAIQFTAPMRAQFGPFQAGMAANMFGEAVQNQNIRGAAALGMAANVLAKYPKAAKMAVTTRLATARMMEQMTKKMSPAERAKFLFEGNTLESLGRAAFAAPAARAQTEEALMSQLQPPQEGQ